MENNEIQKCGAIVCGEVASGQLLILYAVRSESIDEADSGWQFLCGQKNEDLSKTQVWAVHEVLNLDKSLEPFVNFPVGTILSRSTITSPWKVEKANS